MTETEITYCDGGYTSKSTWYGAAITMSNKESKELQANLDLFSIGGSLGVGILASLVAGPFAVWGVFTAYSSLLSSRLGLHTTSRGVILNMTPAAIFWCEGR